MTDLELIQNWPRRICGDCTGKMRPSITKSGQPGQLLLMTVLDSGYTSAWMCCERCFLARSESRTRLEAAAQEGLDTCDMTDWIQKALNITLIPQEDDEMADPLTGVEIMALPAEQRDKLIQLRLIFKSLTETGLDPARVRATIATYEKR